MKWVCGFFQKFRNILLFGATFFGNNKLKTSKKPRYSGLFYGESMWESNPPGQLLTTCNGFEDRGAHQHPSAPKCVSIIACRIPIRQAQNAHYACAGGNPRLSRRKSPSFFVMPVLSKYSRIAKAYLREVPRLSRICARVIVSFSAKCAFAAPHARA